MKPEHTTQAASLLAFIVLVSAIVAVTVTVWPAPGADIALAAEARPAHFTAEVTAYSSSPDETWGDPFITASGRRVHDGLIACPRAYPFGTRFRIGQRVYTCWDRLHERFDHRFDIWKASKQEALQFGRRVLLVEVL